MQTKTILIVNTVLCVLLFAASFFILIASVMSGANVPEERLDLGTFVVVTAMVFPAVPVVSVIGSWLTRRWRKVTLGFVALPWVYTLAHFGALFLMFRS